MNMWLTRRHEYIKENWRLRITYGSMFWSVFVSLSYFWEQHMTIETRKYRWQKQRKKFWKISNETMHKNKCKFFTWVTMVHCKSGGSLTKSSNFVPISIGIAVWKILGKKGRQSTLSKNTWKAGKLI